jgi:hypothetical protein
MEAVPPLWPITSKPRLYGAAFGAASDCKNSSTSWRSFSDRRLYACAEVSPSPSLKCDGVTNRRGAAVVQVRR